MAAHLLPSSLCSSRKEKGGSVLYQRPSGISFCLHIWPELRTVSSSNCMGAEEVITFNRNLGTRFISVCKDKGMYWPVPDSLEKPCWVQVHGDLNKNNCMLITVSCNSKTCKEPPCPSVGEGTDHLLLYPHSKHWRAVTTCVCQCRQI